MKKILGGKENCCPHCAGTMVYIHVPRLGVISQCKCGCTMPGRIRDEIYIYSEDRR